MQSKVIRKLESPPSDQEEGVSMIECHDCVTTWARVCIINLVFTHILGSKSVRVPALVISLDMLHAMTSLPRHVLLLMCLDKCLVIHSFILQPLNIYFIYQNKTKLVNKCN